MIQYYKFGLRPKWHLETLRSRIWLSLVPLIYVLRAYETFAPGDSSFLLLICFFLAPLNTGSISTGLISSENIVHPLYSPVCDGCFPQHAPSVWAFLLLLADPSIQLSSARNGHLVPLRLLHVSIGGSKVCMLPIHYRFVSGVMFHLSRLLLCLLFETPLVVASFRTYFQINRVYVSSRIFSFCIVTSMVKALHLSALVFPGTPFIIM